MPKQIQQGKNWYVLHTYAGYEEAVTRNLKQRIESMGMEDKIFNVLVPTEKKIKIRSGKRQVYEDKIYPGYVLVQMIVTDDSWYVVRNTPNVTGFVGSGNIPVPVTPEEYGIIEKRTGMEQPKFKIDFKVGEHVGITSGPFANYDGIIDKIDPEKGKVKVLVSIFDRETPVELDFTQVKKK